jgi:oligopeptide/dipeptide ABC transporter ATP-binding protein
MPSSPRTASDAAELERSRLQFEKMTQTPVPKLILGLAAPINLLQMPEGCAFCPRCESAMKICLKQQPAEFRVGEDHLASCWMNVKEIYEAQEGGSNEQ